MAARTHRRDSSGRLDPELKRRRRLEAVLRALGLWESFARMPREAQAAFGKCKFPDPVLQFEDSFPADQPHRALRKRLEKAFRECALPIYHGGVPAQISVRDFFSVLAGLKYCVRDSISNPGYPQPCVEFMQKAQPVLDGAYDPHVNDAFAELHQAVIIPLVARSKLDARLLAASVKCESTENGKYVIRTRVGAFEPEVRRVQIDGAARPMVRVASTNGWNGVDWLTWKETSRPVYVQSHALRQLHARVNLPNMAAYLESWLHESLREPNIIDRLGGNESGDLLIEYRIHEHRLGYLVVTVLDDLAAVRTFKFLTMENTPEARLLEQHLKLKRCDIDWLGLHELTAYTQTDLRNDSELRAMLDACGCGHLFELAEDDDGDFAPQVSLQPKAFAADMRKYLRMAA